MRLFIIVYGIVVAVAWGIVTAKPDYFGNVGFLVIGTLVGIYAVFLIEEYKRMREAKNTTRALFYELANRVGRCCFDFESPWAGLLSKHESMNEFRLRKFAPEYPVIFPAVAPQGATQLLAWRLRQTLEPGHRALEALARRVTGAADIERNAMRDADRRFAGAHPNAGKTFRERIELILSATAG
jgi:hypothetical protein